MANRVLPGQRRGQIVREIEQSLIADGVDPISAKGLTYGIVYRLFDRLGPGYVYFGSAKRYEQDVLKSGDTPPIRRRISEKTRF